MAEDTKKLESLDYEPPIKTGVAIPAQSECDWPICTCDDKNCPEQPNQNLMIIEEIEGLLNQVNGKLYELSEPQPIIMKCQKTLRSQAIKEIDLFQKTTLFELRKAFE